MHDTDIDLALDERPATTVPVYIRPAQPYVIASRVVLALAVVAAGAILAAGYTGALTLRSPQMLLLFALFMVLGFVASVLAHRADQQDAPAILINDQEV